MDGRLIKKFGSRERLELNFRARVTVNAMRVYTYWVSRPIGSDEMVAILGEGPSIR